MNILWGLIAIFAILCICSLILVEYPLLQEQYKWGFPQPQWATEPWVLSHQAEIEETRTNFYLGLFSFISQTGLYGVLCVKGFSEFVRRKSQP